MHISMILFSVMPTVVSPSSAGKNICQYLQGDLPSRYECKDATCSENKFNADLPASSVFRADSFGSYWPHTRHTTACIIKPVLEFELFK